MDLSEIQPLRKGRAWDAQEEDKAVTAIIQYSLHIAQRHFAQTGRELYLDTKSTSYWFLFGVRFHQAVIPHTHVLDDAHYLVFLRGVFAEIFDFLMFAYDGDPAREMADLYRAFGSGMHCGPILPLLLPDSAQTVMDKVDRILNADHEEDLRRQDQMGY